MLFHDAYGVAVEFHHLTCDDLVTFPQFDLAIDEYEAVVNGVLGGSPTFAPAFDFKQIAEGDMRAAFEMEYFHKKWSVLGLKRVLKIQESNRSVLRP